MAARGYAALAVAAAAAAVPIGDTIGYQLHSYDDLRELPVILLKGLTSWKIDPQYAPASFCASQPRANHSDARGCFMLNHDLITTSNWYFDLDDVLTAVTSADLLPYFTRPDVHMQIVRAAAHWVTARGSAGPSHSQLLRPACLGSCCRRCASRAMARCLRATIRRGSTTGSR